GIGEGTFQQTVAPMACWLAWGLGRISKAFSRGWIMVPKSEYQYLRPKPGSNYQQLFFGRIRAEVLYRETVGPTPLAPEEVAREYNVPLGAVLEAIDYCQKHKELLETERAREKDRIRAAGRDQWPYAPKHFKPDALNHKH